MLSDDAFSGAHPEVELPVNDYGIEALVYSADAIDAGYRVLKGIASTQRENITTTDRDPLLPIVYECVNHS